MSSFHIRLRERRQALNLTQKQVAEAANVNRTTIAYYEDGKREPTLTTLIGIADILEVSVDWLAGREKDINESEYVPVYQLPPPGEPLEQPELIVGREMVNRKMQVMFCIIANDNSMQGSRIFKGDLVRVKKMKETDKLSSGDTVVVEIEGHGVLIRRAIFNDESDTITFHAEEPTTNDLVFKKNNMELTEHKKPPYRIIGKVAYSRVWMGR